MDIERFSISGEIADEKYTPRLREYLEKEMTLMMHWLGFIERADLDRDFTLSYNDGVYYFTLSVYGSYVGDDAIKGGVIDGFQRWGSS